MKKIIYKIRNKQKLSKEENDWLNMILTKPPAFCRIFLDVLGIKNETISDKMN